MGNFSFRLNIDVSIIKIAKLVRVKFKIVEDMALQNLWSSYTFVLRAAIYRNKKDGAPRCIMVKSTIWIYN